MTALWSYHEFAGAGRREEADVRKVRELVAAVTRDDAALHNLRFDPAVLARTVGLDARQLSALHSAERFFATEKPIPDAAAGVPVPAPPPPPVPGPLEFLAASLAASADTGTLLTGPTSGTYTVSSSATATATTPPARVLRPRR